METFYILDTCSLYSYCNRYLNIFQNRRISLNEGSLRKLKSAFYSKSIKIILPGIIFVEIFDHYSSDKEIINKFRYEFYLPLITDEDTNIYISGIDSEVLDNLPLCYTDDTSIDLHDKIILATSLKYSDKNTLLFTSDERIKKIKRKNNLNITIQS